MTPALVEIPTTAPDVIAFALRGPVTAEDFRATAARLRDAYEQHARVKLLIRIEAGLHMRLEVLRERILAVKRDTLRHIDRYAVVGGPRWLSSVIAALDPLFRVEIKAFELADEFEAWSWLEAREADKRCITPNTSQAS